MDFSQTKLANGLTIVAEVNPHVASMAAGFFVPTGSRDEGRKTAGPRRTQLVILPPVNYSQLASLRASLQEMAQLRVLSTAGSLEGGATISVHLDQPIALADHLKDAAAIEEAIEEDMLDLHPLGDFLRRAMPVQLQKKREGQRIFVVLKKPNS